MLHQPSRRVEDQETQPLRSCPQPFRRQRRHLSDEGLLVHISAVYAENRGAYGWPRMPSFRLTGSRQMKLRVICLRIAKLCAAGLDQLPDSLARPQGTTHLLQLIRRPVLDEPLNCAILVRCQQTSGTFGPVTMLDLDRCPAAAKIGLMRLQNCVGRKFALTRRLPNRNPRQTKLYARRHYSSRPIPATYANRSSPCFIRRTSKENASFL